MNVSLVMIKSDGTCKTFPINKERTIVGRTNTCDLRIPVSSVSRRHCELIQDGDVFKLRDLGSSNGTFYNDTRLLETELNAGDRVGIGPVVFTVVIDGQPDYFGSSAAPETPLEEGKEATAETTSEANEFAASWLQGDATHAKSEAVPQPAVAEKQAPAKGQVVEPEDHELPAHIEEEQFTPTVDLDDDPVAALQALAHAADDEDDIPVLEEHPADSKPAK